MSCILLCVVVTYTHVNIIYIFTYTHVTTTQSKIYRTFPNCSFLVCLFSQSPPQRQSMLIDQFFLFQSFINMKSCSMYCFASFFAHHVLRFTHVVYISSLFLILLTSLPFVSFKKKSLECTLSLYLAEYILASEKCRGLAESFSSI